jgi:hypothetical protein
LLAIFISNFWQLPALLNTPVLSIIAATLLFGGVLALIYAYVFNRSARQGPHDLLVGSVVVRPLLPGQKFSAPLQRQRHIMMVWGLFGVVLLIISFLMVWVDNDNDLHDLYVALNEDSPFFVVEVARSGNHLTLAAWYDKSCASTANPQRSSAECDALVQDMGDIVYQEYDALDEIDTVEVIVYRKKDLGLIFRVWAGTADAAAGRDDAFYWYAQVQS